MKTLQQIMESESQDKKVVKRIEKAFPAYKVKNVESKRTITFILNEFIDERDFDHFPIIDGILDILEKSYKDAIVKHDGRKFIVQEL